MTYTSVLYRKGDTTRRALSPRDAVRLEFDGFVKADTIPAPPTARAELQARAKELGINARQSNEAPQAAIDEANAPEASGLNAPDVSNTSALDGSAPETEDDDSLIGDADEVDTDPAPAGDDS